MKQCITKRQKELLKAIYQHIKNTGYPPSFEEMREKLNVSSNQAILDLLEALEKRRMIQREEKSARSIKIKPVGYQTLGVELLVPVAGTSYAGAFAESIELTGNWQTASPEVATLKENVYIIKVSGDSMTGAKIYDGDYLLVQEQKEFKPGDIVVAQTSEGTTVKRFISNKDTICLQPENPKYKPIYFTEEVEMVGKIIGKWEAGRVKSLTQRRFL